MNELLERSRQVTQEAGRISPILLQRRLGAPLGTILSEVLTPLRQEFPEMDRPLLSRIRLEPPPPRAPAGRRPLPLPRVASPWPKIAPEAITEPQPLTEHKLPPIEATVIRAETKPIVKPEPVAETPPPAPLPEVPPVPDGFSNDELSFG